MKYIVNLIWSLVQLEKTTIRLSQKIVIYLGIHPLPSIIETSLVIFEEKPAKRRYP